MFDRLAPGYDWFNALSSLGLHGRWRRKAAQQFKPGSMVLDVGTGTGDLARALALMGCTVTGVDVSERMISVARAKLSCFDRVNLIVSSAQELPFPSQSFDGVTSAFVIRNLHQTGLFFPSLKEFFRVLRPGGRMVHLELTRPTSTMMTWGHQIYLRFVLPVMGRLIFGRHWPQSYLASTIQQFPDPDDIVKRFREVGFGHVQTQFITGGIATLFIGERC